MDVEALRHHDVEVVLGARHRHIEQPAFFLDLFRGARGEVGRHAAIHRIEHVDRLPLLALGRMDRRQDQVVLVARGHAGFIAGRARRIERQFGQEALARGIGGRDPLDLLEIGLPRGGIVVNALQMRQVPRHHLLELRWPRRGRRHQPARQGDQLGPGRRGGGRGLEGFQRQKRLGGRFQPPQHARGGFRAHAGQQLQGAEAGHAVARILQPAHHGHHVLDVG
ncbi:hypothetical protein D3C86_1463070 [compost metagenome]